MTIKEAPEVIAARHALLDIDARYIERLSVIKDNGNDPHEYDRVWKEWIDLVAPLERILGA